MAFMGWPRAAVDVLTRLQGDPSPSMRESIRSERERLVRVQMVDLLHDLADRDPIYADHSVWRYGTTAWWWQNQAATIRLDRNVEIGLGLDLDGMRIQGAWWFGGPDQRERYRAAVVGRAGARLQHLVDDLSSRIEGDVMVRVPRGYPRDHRRAQLLKHRSLLAVRHLPVGDWLFTKSALDDLEAAATELRPLLEWLSDHVSSGPEPS